MVNPQPANVITNRILFLSWAASPTGQQFAHSEQYMNISSSCKTYGVSDTASRFCFLPDSCPILSTGPWRTTWRIVFAPTNSWTPKTTLISSPTLLISQYWDSHTGSTIVLSLPSNSTGNRILYLYVNSITTSFSWLTWIVHIGIKPSPLKTVMSHPILCLWKRDAWVK